MYCRDDAMYCRDDAMYCRDDAMFIVHIATSFLLAVGGDRAGPKVGRGGEKGWSPNRSFFC